MNDCCKQKIVLFATDFSDGEHRAWLLTAAAHYIEDEPVPKADMKITPETLEAVAQWAHKQMEGNPLHNSDLWDLKRTARLCSIDLQNEAL